MVDEANGGAATMSAAETTTAETSAAETTAAKTNTAERGVEGGGGRAGVRRDLRVTRPARTGTRRRIGSGPTHQGEAPMEITEVRVKLMEDPHERLLAFCSITFDGCFVVRSISTSTGAVPKSAGAP